MDTSGQDLQGKLIDRLKPDLVSERLEGVLQTLDNHLLKDPPGILQHQVPALEASLERPTPSDATAPQATMPLDLQLDTLPGLSNKDATMPQRRSWAGPRRLVKALAPPADSDEQDAGDLGGQLMHPSDSTIPNQSSPSTASKPALPLRRFVPIRRKAMSPAAQSPAFMDALTSLLSPAMPSPTQPVSAENLDSPPLVGVLGLGITDSSLHGLGISDVRDPLLDLKDELVEAVEPRVQGSQADSAAGPTEGLIGDANLASLVDDHLTSQVQITSLPAGPSLIPDLLHRKSGSRRGLRRRAVGASDTTPSSLGQGQYSPSSYSPSTYYSPIPTYSPIPYTPSPLVSDWNSPSPSSYYSPSVYESPAPTSGSSPYLVYNAVLSTSTYCPPNATTTTASPLASSSAVMSPIITSSPLLGTPRITDSPVFSSPSLATDPENFESATSVVKASAATTTTPPIFAQSANNMSNSSLLTVQAVVSGLMSVLLFFACCIAAWFLVRRRKPKQPLAISSPLPQVEYKGGDHPDDDVESKSEMDGHQTRFSEVPTLPESVLPARLWRNSTASHSGGVSEFRKSVEEGLGNLGMNRLPTSPGNKRISSYSAHERRGTEASQHHRSPSLPYRPQRYSSLPNIQSIPVTPSATYSSFDRNVRQSMMSSADSELAMSSKWEQGTRDSMVEAPVLRVVNTDVTPSEEARPPSPTFSVHSKASTKSSKSKLWALRKTAIVSSASASVKKESKPMDISLPLGRPTKQVIRQAETSVNDADISNSVNMVLLDTEVSGTESAKSTNSVEQTRPRPLSQDAVLPKNKLRKRSSSLGVPKSRPATIGHTPPAIFVTDHPQALVPPPSPKVNRISTYSLSDTLPYTISASPSVVSTNIGTSRDDCSFIDPDMHAYGEAYQPDFSTPEDGTATRPESMQSNASSLAESCNSVDTMDLDTDDEQLRRSQRRRTLLYQVYAQGSQSQPDGLSAWATDSTKTVKGTDHDPPAVETPKRPQGKSDIVSSFPPVPLPPLTPPYTPVESRFPDASESPFQQSETPSNRMRSVSAGAPKPVLDAALTRFSRLDLASEFSLSQFGSQTSIKSIGRDKDGKFVLPAPTNAATPSIPARSQRRQSTCNPTASDAAYTPVAAQSTATRRTRSSTVGDKPLFFGSPSSTEAMMTASRIPLPSRSKATRVSVATAKPPPSPAPTMRSIAQDLRASVSFPSGYESPMPRPSSIRSSYSSIGITSEYRRSSVIDFTHRPNSLELSHQPNEKNFRSSNGSLSLPRLDEEEDDDRSVYSRDSGSHESAWELAKARVRARASLALPSVMEELI